MMHGRRRDGRSTLRPYEILGEFVGDLDQSMDVVWHNDETIQLDVGEMTREIRPTGSDDIAKFIEHHVAVINLSE